jgi:hypothetical protein
MRAIISEKDVSRHPPFVLQKSRGFRALAAAPKKRAKKELAPARLFAKSRLQTISLECPIGDFYGTHF